MTTQITTTDSCFHVSLSDPHGPKEEGSQQRLLLLKVSFFPQDEKIVTKQLHHTPHS